jgi:hypothetical protein
MIKKKLAFLKLEFGLNKLSIELLGSIFSVFNICLDVPSDIKWSNSIIVECFIGVILELKESRRHNSHDISTFNIFIFTGIILTDSLDFWNSKSFFLFKLI